MPTNRLTPTTRINATKYQAKQRIPLYYMVEPLRVSSALEWNLTCTHTTMCINIEFTVSLQYHFRTNKSFLFTDQQPPATWHSVLISTTRQCCNLKLAAYASVAPKYCRCYEVLLEFVNQTFVFMASCLTRPACVQSKTTGSAPGRYGFGSLAGIQARSWPHGVERLQACPSAAGNGACVYVVSSCVANAPCSCKIRVLCFCNSCHCTSHKRRHSPLRHRPGATVVHPA